MSSATQAGGGKSVNEQAESEVAPSPFIVPLQAIGADDVALAGSKGARLGELLRAGFPVPPGFVVTPVAYDRFVACNHLDEVIVRASREQASRGATIRDAFEKALFPAEVKRRILAAYRQLGPGPVAVRSSAPAEDLAQTAFAGQYETCLNVVGQRAVLAAVRRCWASLWNDRAIAYCARQGMDQAAAKLAVVVQRMVEAEVAGVMFTVNPVTGAGDEIVIEANPGLGQAVASGLVTPDRIVLDRRSGQVKEQRLGRREVIILARPGGGIERVDGLATANTPVLPAATIRYLARLGLAIERHFGCPQDVEWAWADGTLFILQARPITALPPASIAGSGEPE
jgi:phosphoenolpyruvate synthase/pyruvate phosphate dikinase